MDLVAISIAIFFFIVAFILFDKHMKNDAESFDDEKIVSTDPSKIGTGGVADQKAAHDEAVPGDSVKEVVYTQDYYPWWRSTRWWNYDGWLYQKPYYNYWRRPNYYNYWYSGRPLIIGGKRYYKRQFW